MSVLAFAAICFVAGAIGGMMAGVLWLRHEARRRERILNKVFGEEQPR